MKLASRVLLSVPIASCLVAGLATEGDAAIRARALGAWVNVPGYGVVNHNVCDTGWLPAVGGGSQNASEPDYQAGSVLSMQQATASAFSNDDCRGHDNIARVDLGYTVLMEGYASETSFTALHGRDRDECCEEDDDFTAADFTDLVFAGVPVVVTGLPDQEVVIAGAGRLVINGRHRDRDDDDCDDDDFTINALHLYPQSGGEIIVGSVIYDDDDDCCNTPSLPRSWGSIKILYR